MAARNLDPSRTFIEFMPLPYTVDTDDDDMVFAKLNLATTYQPNDSHREVVRLVPEDAAHFLPRVVDANDLILFQSY